MEQSAAAKPGRATKAETLKVARAYFSAIDRHDLEAAVGMWRDENVRGQVDTTAPDGVRAFLGGLFASIPDLRMSVVDTTTESARCAVRWRLTGTFAGPEPFNGIAPTGARIELEGVDVVTVEGGLIGENNAFSDSMSFARQVGIMPQQGSGAEQRLTGAFNAKTNFARRLSHAEPQRVADGVWTLQGEPAHCNVYFLEEADGGVCMFDAGARTMTTAVATAAAHLGGLNRIVLGHGHTDHRGSAPALGVPVFCHADEIADAEGSGGWRYWSPQLEGLAFPHRQMHKLLHRYAWDGGPVKISGAVSEGEEIAAGFRVIELPGHAPGLIGLWREEDRIALVSDCFYTLDMWGRDNEAHTPLVTYNFDTEQARASIRTLAAMEPAEAWPGHAKPVRGSDVPGQIERAADIPG